MHLIELDILFISVVITNCFVTHNPNKIFLKKHTQYKGDESLSRVYEMGKKQNNLETTAYSKIFRTVNKANSNQNKMQIKTALSETTTSKTDKSSAKHVDLISNYDQIPDVGKFQSKDLPEYSYNDLVQEYYLQAAEDGQNENAFHINQNDDSLMITLQKFFFLTKLTSNCTEEETRGFGIKAVKCIMQDYKYKRQSLKVTTEKLWRVIKIWFLLYFLVALPLWFTGGWCCCCLFCKIFKPNKTIQEAKKYLLANPPGVFKDKYGETYYIPSEREKAKYEEFEHLLRTI